MRLRRRMFLSFALTLILVLALMVLLQSTTGQRDRQERAFGLVSMQARDLARLRGAMEDDLVDPSVYFAQLSRLDESFSAWVVDAGGNIFMADLMPSDMAQIIQSIDKNGIVKPFTASDIEQYVAPALSGKPDIVTGDWDGRLAHSSVTAIEPVWRSDGGVTSAFFLHRDFDALERGDIFVVWRQSALAALGAAAVGLLLIGWQSVRIARPAERLAAKQGKAAGDEMQAIGREMASMREQIEELEVLHRGFVSNVSHELRSPLTNIIGYLQGLIDGAVEEGDRARYTAVALEEARRMSALIGDLLNLSRLESGRFALNTERFDLCELVRRTLVANANAIEGKRIRLKAELREDAIYVDADPQWIRQALDNLLGNAIKFVEEGGGITVRAQIVQDRAYVTVADDGPGIDKEDLEHVFEWFYKADKSHATTGTGLGLAIVHSIMDRHGQAVRISSQPGRGTIVTFSLALCAF